MKITGVPVMAVMVGTCVWAGAMPEAKQVTVCMSDPDMVLGNGALLLNGAEAVASDLFAGIGVKIQWRQARNCSAPAIHITLSNSTPSTFRPNALAYALPYEGTHIVIFYDRVRNTVEPGKQRCLLGHVIAHEVTHILQGVARHSESGVMKAQWNGDDYQHMAWKPLQFTGIDVQLIYCGLKAREARLAAIPPTAAHVSPAASQ
jgi:hypothetical protein